MEADAEAYKTGITKERNAESDRQAGRCISFLFVEGRVLSHGNATAVLSGLLQGKSVCTAGGAVDLSGRLGKTGGEADAMEPAGRGDRGSVRSGKRG